MSSLGSMNWVEMLVMLPGHAPADVIFSRDRLGRPHADDAKVHHEQSIASSVQAAQSTTDLASASQRQHGE